MRGHLSRSPQPAPRKRFTLALAVLWGSGWGCGRTPPSPPLRQSVAIPAYFESEPLWARIERASAIAPMAIVNPEDGVGSGPVPSLVRQVQRSRTAGVQVLGYVATRYGGRPSGDVLREVELYKQWYGVDGIFFDEASTDCGIQPYYAALNDHVKGWGGAGRTVLNPGTATMECYMTAADVLVTFEDNYKTYVDSYTAPSWLAKYAPDRFWHLIYGASSPPLMRKALALSKSRGAGWVYVTSEDVPNPWQRLPPEDYWAQELRAARGRRS